ncbi:hypothetical protein [Chitinophaga sp. CF118]|uniref:beta strand repeat-containing protein n=1 Tax=Chitinophaga sp. CF118 TaxID=1884367 RepID=UPI0011607ECF|nr:hypothetical protein [Chitinophaga sp. CF118]
MKTKFYVRIVQLLTLFLLSSSLLNAQQLKLGDNPGTMQKSALLELESKSQGLLLPRITDTTLATIKASPDGMIIFLTLNNSLCIRANGAWQKLIPEGQAITSMNGSTVPVQTITATSNAAPASISTVGGNHFVNLPDATTSYSGFINTGAQTFAGAKTFNDNLTANQDLLLPNIVVDNTKDSVLLIDNGKVWKKRLTGLPPTGAAGGDLTGTYPTPAIAAGAVTGAKMAQAGATTGQVLKWNGTTWAPAADDNTGSLSSVGLTAPSIFTVTGSPLTANGSIGLGLQTQAANTFWGGPNTGAAATPTFRTLVAADIPALPFSNITGVVPIAQGGTDLTTVGANGTFLTSNGTSIAYRTLAAADIPSLPFSKITGTVPVTQGGTGLTTVGANGTFLTSNGTNMAYRTLTAADIPSLPFSNITGVVPIAQGGTNLTTVGANGTVLTSNGTTLSYVTPTVGLTSVGLTMPSIFSVAGSPLTANGTIATTLQNQTANIVFAGPNTGAAAAPTFRSLVAADIPALPFSNITGVVPIAQGGTNLTTVGANGTFLTSNGTSMAYRTLTAADIPSLPFSNITGIVPIAQGGTALSTVGASGTVLTSNGTTLSYATPSVTLAGDVTGASGSNTIGAGVVTYAKIQNVTTQKLLGRYTASTGSVQEVSLDNSLKLTTGGILYADSSLAIWNASKLQGKALSPLAPTAGQVLKWNGTAWEGATDNNTGTLTSVGLTMPSIFSVTGSPLTANGTIATTLQTQTANTIFAGPNTGAAAAPTFRPLVAADIPSLPFSSITGIVPIAQGGTALSTVGASGTVLTSNGTTLSYSALGGDVTGTIAANTIAAKAVTYAKIQDVTTQKLLGRYTASTGSVQEVSLDNSIKLTTAGTLYADSSLAIWNASELQGRRVSAVAPTDNYILKWDAASSTWGPEVETAATNWLFTGNSNTTATSFLGTTVDQPMVLKYNNNELFRGTKGTGLYALKTVSLFNGASSYNGHPVVIRANGVDVLAFQDSTGTMKWHWNLLGSGLNFVESNVADYRLFLQNGGNVGIGTSTPSALLDVEGTVQLGVGGTVLTNVIRAVGTTSGAANVVTTTPLLVTFNIAGATTTSTVMVSPQAALPGAIGIGAAYVLTAGVVTVKFINTNGTTSLPNNSKFSITIINY